MEYKVIFVFTLIAVSESINLKNNFEKSSENEIVYEKWNKLDQKIKELVNYGMKMALPTIIRATSEMNLTSTCMKQGFEFAMGLRNLKRWAIEFIDSSGKGIDGFLAGTSSAFGNYDGCLNAVAIKSKSGGKEDVMFRGKYCVVELKPVLPIKTKEYSYTSRLEGLIAATQNGSDLIKLMALRAHTFYAAAVNIGICVPSGCNVEDLEHFVKYIAGIIYFDSKVLSCEDQIRKYDTSFITAAFFYALAAFLVVVATMVHLYAKHKNIKFQNKALQILLEFSFDVNFQKLFNTKTENESLAFLNGMRFLTAAWIILTHAYLVSFISIPLQRNLLYVYDIFSYYFAHLMQQIVFNGNIAVVTFLFVGGLLNCYQRVKELEVTKRQCNIFKYILYRLWRIYPAYLYSIFMSMMLHSLGDGPIYLVVPQEYMHDCKRYWWRNLLFINNFYHLGKSCLPHFWYVAVDMQLYLVSLITVPVLLKWPRFGVPLNALVVLVSIAFSGIYTWLYDLPPSFVTTHLKQEIAAYYNVHANPVMNASPYFLGILTGYLLARKRDIRLSRVIQWIGWLLSFVLSCSAIFGTKKWNAGVEPTELERILYPCLAKTTFALGVAWVVICCATGHGGVVNYILSRSLWLPLARLSFLIYLTSFMLQLHFMGNFRSASNFSNLIIVWRFFGDLFASAIAAFIIAMLVEVPSHNIRKMIFSKTRKNNQQITGVNVLAMNDDNCKDNDHEKKIMD